MIPAASLPDKRADVLLATYKATKDEIAHRAALQWAILAGYALFLYNAFSAVLKPDLRLVESVVWPTVAWATSAIALLFHRREQQEIMRLSRIISDLIEPQLQTLGLGELLFERFGFLDEEAQRVRYDLALAARRERLFNIAIFILGPLGLTALAVVQMISRLH